MSRVKRQPTEREGIFPNYVSGKESISGKYEELPQLNNKNTALDSGKRGLE